MSNLDITVEGGKSIKLKTAGKYCDRDIVVTATGQYEVWTITYTDGTVEEKEVLVQ